MISPRKIGVGNGNRTRNRRSHSPVLCQLSYSHRKKTIIATAIADVRSGKKVVSCSGLTISHPQESEERRSLVPLIKARGFGMTPRARYQKLTRTPSRAAKGMPTVVPGPKKSPRPPAGTANCCRREIGCVAEHAAWAQRSVMLPAIAWAAGTMESEASEAALVTKFAPGL